MFRNDNILDFFSQSVREKPYPDEERVKGDPARDLAIVHHLCETSLSDLQNFARSVVSKGSKIIEIKLGLQHF